MNTATITISHVEQKTGVSQKTGKPWTKHILVDSTGGKYSTFDAGMAGEAGSSLGKTAVVTYETGQFGNDLHGIQITGAAPPAQAPPAAKPNGDTDWDMIGLRKTRCALWTAAIGAGLPEAGARSIVMAAEADIFHRDPARSIDDSIPF